MRNGHPGHAILVGLAILAAAGCNTFYDTESVEFESLDLLDTGSTDTTSPDTTSGDGTDADDTATTPDTSPDDTASDIDTASADTVDGADGDDTDLADTIDMVDTVDMVDTTPIDIVECIGCGGANCQECGEVCVDVDVDDQNCGLCGVVCTERPNTEPGTGSCDAGTCVLTCAAGYTDCNGDPSDGCEAQLDGDVGNCGTCGNDCSASGRDNVDTYACMAGECVIAEDGCAADFADCDGTFSNGCEINLTTSTTNCGACANNCRTKPNVSSSGTTCVAARCVPTCMLGFGDCNSTLMDDGCETDLNEDCDHCSQCGMACGSANECNGGTCEFSLAPSCP